MQYEKRALVVLLDKNERDATTQLLSRMGLAVNVVASGEEAVYWLEDHDCDLLVLDAQLPDMHAWTMLHDLKELIDLSQLPTIVFTSKPTLVPMHNVTTLVAPIPESHLRQVLGDLLA